MTTRDWAGALAESILADNPTLCLGELEGRVADALVADGYGLDLLQHEADAIVNDAAQVALRNF